MRKLSLLLLFVVIFLLSDSIRASAEEMDWIEEHSVFWDGKAKISGELRIRGESFNDFDFDDDVNTTNLDDDFFLSRARMGLDVKPIEMVRFFIQFQDSHQFETDVPTAFRVGPAAREDRVDVHQAFVDIRPDSDLPLVFRVGRQELSYGRQRVIGAFGWSNVGRTFQGIKVMCNTDDFFVDAFGVDVVIPEDRHFNDPDTRDDFYGVYGGWKKFPMGTIEAYLLFRDNERLDREVYTLGTRLAGSIPNMEAVDYSLEFALQGGDYARGVDQEAFAVHAGAGYTAIDYFGKPRLGVEYNFSTGDDDPNDGENETFDNLYPTNHLHYGSMDLFSWRNMHDLSINARATPVEKLTVQCDLHFFWLDDTSDAWYNAGGNVVRPATPGADDFVGEEIDLTASYKCNKYITLMAGYSHFFAGEFVDDTGPGDDADWVFAQTTLRF